MEKIVEIRKNKFIINKDTTHLEIPSSIETKGDWCESFETDIFEKILEKGMNVLDLGANIGWYSLIAARKIGSYGKVFAFEPDSFTYDLLLSHIKLNNYKNITAVKKAVSDKEGTETFYSYHFTPRDGKSGFYPRDYKYEPKITKVETVRVDKFLENFNGKINVVKMDIEGAEFKALKGMKKTLNDVKYLFTEVNAETTMKAKVPYGMFFKEIKKYGFRVYYIDEENKKLEKLDKFKLIKRVEDAPRKWINLFCTKKTSFP